MACEVDRPHAGIHVDDRLLARCDDAGKIAVLVAQASMIVDGKVAPIGFVTHDCLNAERLHDMRGNIRRSRCGDCENHGVCELTSKRAQDIVGRPLASTRLRHMVRFVDDHEADTPACGYIVHMARKILGRGEHHVDSSVGKPLIDRSALSRRRLSSQRRSTKTEPLEKSIEVKLLVGDESPQRIHQDARLALAQGAACGMYLEDERLPTPRPHDSKRVDALVKAL